MPSCYKFYSGLPVYVDLKTWRYAVLGLYTKMFTSETQWELCD
jgi:hypothetical protein